MKFNKNNKEDFYNSNYYNYHSKPMSWEEYQEKFKLPLNWFQERQLLKIIKPLKCKIIIYKDPNYHWESKHCNCEKFSRPCPFYNDEIDYLIHVYERKLKRLEVLKEIRDEKEIERKLNG